MDRLGMGLGIVEDHLDPPPELQHVHLEDVPPVEIDLAADPGLG
jgi:hypothetical protein